MNLKSLEMWKITVKATVDEILSEVVGIIISFVSTVFLL